MEETPKPSKTQRKRDVEALQQLGVELVELNASQLVQIEMPEQLLEAVLEGQRIRNFEGRRRQMQFVGKMMRKLDEEEVAAIQRTIDSWKGASKAETAALHALERRREKLLADDKELTRLLEAHPELDVQQRRVAELQSLLSDLGKTRAADGARLAQLEKALAEAREALEASRREHGQTEALFALAEAHAAAGEVEEGRETASQAQQLHEAKGNVVAAGRARVLSEELAARTTLTRG